MNLCRLFKILPGERMSRKWFPWIVIISAQVALVGLARVVNGAGLPGFSIPFSRGLGPAPAIAELRPVEVLDVGTDIGLGSPIPVEAVVSGTWPDVCAQLAKVEQRFEGTSFEVSLLASPFDPTCSPDHLGLPFRIAIPLNMVELEPGKYHVVVNGVETSFEWAGSLGQSSASMDMPAVTLTYLGADGNVWLMDTLHNLTQQITMDAASEIPSENQTGKIVQYYFPKISSDGSLIAFRRDEGVPTTSGFDYTFGLWVYDQRTGETQLVFDQIPAGFAWKPGGEHLLAYGQGLSEGYFTARGEINASLATGIFGINLDTGITAELVTPERGYSLFSPVWSPDGRFISFEEVNNYEGSGLFAFFDNETREYIAWDDVLGFYDWSPDGTQLVYDRLTYSATGTERVYLQPRVNREERQVSSDSSPSYAISPVFSPAGDQIAYFINHEGPDSQVFTLYIHNLGGRGRISLGEFESVHSLSWSPDGSHLIFSAGQFESHQVFAVHGVDGKAVVLAQGSTPDLSGL
jgi:Tol biopolymer transport system component